MKTNGIHISHILNDYLNQCRVNFQIHEFTLRPERIYMGLTTTGIRTRISSLNELKNFPFVVVHVPGELNVLRIHAFQSWDGNRAYVYSDDHVQISEVDKARLNGVIACAIYQHTSNPSLTMVNF